MPSAATADPPACCSPHELTPCSTCPPAPDRRAAVARLHAEGRTTAAIAAGVGRCRATVRSDLRALGLEPNRRPAHRRPGNTTPERLAQIAQGVLIDRVDGAFAAITAACLEELESFLPETDLDLAPLASSVAVRVVQASLLAWFPEAFEEDPETVRAGKVEVLRRRAESERRAGRPELAAHWDEMAGSVDCRGGLVPANGTLERVSREGFVALVDKLKGGPAAD